MLLQNYVAENLKYLRRITPTSLSLSGSICNFLTHTVMYTDVRRQFHSNARFGVLSCSMCYRRCNYYS
jgi:hypothetical protein